jgi:hypothetical protein
VQKFVRRYSNLLPINSIISTSSKIEWQMFFHLPHYQWPKQWPIQQAYEFHSSDILPKFSNIRVLYVFLGFLKNTWKYLIQRPIFKPLYNYNVFLKILENTSFWAPSKNTRISYVTTMMNSKKWITNKLFVTN